MVPPNYQDFSHRQFVTLLETCDRKKSDLVWRRYAIEHGRFFCSTQIFYRSFCDHRKETLCVGVRKLGALIARKHALD